ncbi:MAG: hypothetical protein LBE33_01540 [Zoogloeaceae bacterium]|jgi:hypothetical protein|nr:hypothetical protein [Zoogloeaceae bacterium]
MSEPDIVLDMFDVDTSALLGVSSIMGFVGLWIWTGHFLVSALLAPFAGGAIAMGLWALWIALLVVAGVTRFLSFIAASWASLRLA